MATAEPVSPAALVAPGSNPLPGGLSLNASSGVISGTIGALNSGTNVTFRVVDTPSQGFVERTFSIVGVASLYDFISHTFTTAGKYGRFGPTLTELRSAYSPSWTDNTNYLNVTSTGIQKWTVPITGTYTITARGSGSVTTNKGGYGARITGTCTLTISEIIYILVGQTAINETNSANHCGGGGTFVVRTPYNTNASIIVIAGGGGGGHNLYTATTGNASLTTTGNIGTGVGAGSGGTNGGAGGNGYGYGGAGFFGNNTSSALSFVNGGTGDYYNSNDGGFGGGGRHGNTHGGGGGGYSGGGGAKDTPHVGGGGGSYKASSFTVTSESTTVHNGPGSVLITLN